MPESANAVERLKGVEETLEQQLGLGLQVVEDNRCLSLPVEIVKSEECGDSDDGNPDDEGGGCTRGWPLP